MSTIKYTVSNPMRTLIPFAPKTVSMTVPAGDRPYLGPDEVYLPLRDALANGIVVPAIELFAEKAGFNFPVVLSNACYREFVAWTENDCQDEKGRLWDVLNLARAAMQSGTDDFGRAIFGIHCVPLGRSKPKARLLKIGLMGDEMDDPFFLITLPRERVANLHREQATDSAN